MHSSSGQDCNSDEGTDEEDIKKNGQKSEEGQAAEEDCEDDSKASIDDSTAGHAFHGFHPGRKRVIAVGKHWERYQQ